MTDQSRQRVYDPLRPAAIAVALAALALTAFVLWRHPPLVTEFLSSRGKDFYSVTASVAGALLGFLIAGVSIMLTMSPKGVLGAFMNSQLSKQVFASFFDAARLLGFTTLVAIVGVMVDTGWKAAEVNLCLTIGALVLAALYTYRSLQLLQRITFLAIQENIERFQQDNMTPPQLEPRSDSFTPPAVH